MFDAVMVGRKQTQVGRRYKAKHIKRSAKLRKEIKNKGWHIVKQHRAANPRLSVSRIERKRRMKKAYRAYKRLKIRRGKEKVKKGAKKVQKKLNKELNFLSKGMIKK
jgi:hypothetical protein